MISGKAETTERWNEHSKQVLNRKDPERPIMDAKTDNAEIAEINTESPTTEEVKKAIKLLKTGNQLELAQ